MVMADIFSCFRSNFILHLSTEKELKCLHEKLINVGTKWASQQRKHLCWASGIDKAAVVRTIWPSVSSHEKYLFTIWLGTIEVNWKMFALQSHEQWWKDVNRSFTKVDVTLPQSTHKTFQGKFYFIIILLYMDLIYGSLLFIILFCLTKVHTHSWQNKHKVSQRQGQIFHCWILVLPNSLKKKIFQGF